MHAVVIKSELNLLNFKALNVTVFHNRSYFFIYIFLLNVLKKSNAYFELHFHDMIVMYLFHPGLDLLVLV